MLTKKQSFARASDVEPIKPDLSDCPSLPEGKMAIGVFVPWVGSGEKLAITEVKPYQDVIPFKSYKRDAQPQALHVTWEVQDTNYPDTGRLAYVTNPWVVKLIEATDNPIIVSGYLSVTDVKLVPPKGVTAPIYDAPENLMPNDEGYKERRAEVRAYNDKFFKAIHEFNSVCFQIALQTRQPHSNFPEPILITATCTEIKQTLLRNLANG